MIDPNIWQSEDFSNLSILARIIFIGLFSNADDEGRGRAKTNYIKSILFPYDENITTQEVENALNEIAQNTSIFFYTHNNNEYYCLTNWKKWQKIDRPQPSKIDMFSEQTDTIIRTFDEYSTNNRRLVPPNIIQHNTIQDNTNKDNTTITESYEAGANIGTSDVVVVVDKIVDFYNNNIGLITPYTAEMLQDYINNGMSEDVIIFAMQEAIKQAKPTMSYINGILKNWKQQNIKTLVQAQKLTEDFQKNKKNKETKEERQLRIQKEMEAKLYDNK